MWAQLIKVRLKPGKDLAEVATHLRASEQPGSGLVREMFGFVSYPGNLVPRP